MAVENQSQQEEKKDEQEIEEKENQKLEDLPIDRIIQTFEDGMKFESDYNLIAKADGSLGTVKIAQTKNQTENKIPETEQEER